jgi:arylformamidase
VGTSINTALALTNDTAARLSPLRFDLAGFVPTLVCWGENETDAFKCQSQAFAQALQAVGALAAPAMEMAGRNHFDVILDLVHRGTGLGDAGLQRLHAA